MRLYYFPKNSRKAALSFPVGIGGKGQETLLGSYRIIEKTTNPSWHVPESIRLEKPDLPKTVLPGPDNPLGRYALRLSRHNILIHGTNRPFSIGRQATHGCIRLYPEDIRKLFTMVRHGTNVTIISQPVKVAEVDGSVYMEVHKDEGRDLLKEAKMRLRAMRLMEKIDGALLFKAILEMKGIPVNISRQAAL
jgi:L,D-transpeptidase ErfK/SrfK